MKTGRVLNKLNFGDNSFDFLRLFAAIEILWYHVNMFVPFEGAAKTFGGFYGHFFKWAISSVQGVVILFAISGFLIPMSFEKSKNAFDFLKKRLVRLYPALAVSFFVTFAIIMIVYRPQLDLKKIVVWFGTQLTVLQSYTPDFLREYGSGNPNGSLWTIFTEIQMYVVVALFYRWIKKLRLRGWITLITGSIAANIACYFLQNRVPHSVYRLMFISFIPYFYIFAIGMFLYFYRDTIGKFLANHVWYIVSGYLLFSVVAYIFIPKTGFYNPIYMGILLPFVIVALAYGLGRHRLPFDISYGMYLYHLIFVNLLIELGFTSCPMAFAIVLPLSIAAGFFSYYLVDKPVHKLLNRKK